MLKNAKRDKQQAVCLACAERGFSPRDIAAYTCIECGDWGHLRFPRQMLADYKRRERRRPLVCTACCTRQQAIEAKLKEKKAIKCTCPGQQHSYANEKCKLFPQKAGEKRWPGCNLKDNLEVTLEDWHFVERMRKRQKK